MKDFRHDYYAGLSVWRGILIALGIELAAAGIVIGLIWLFKHTR